jgi:RNA polymerase sigma-70 factor (ECF subfamily)
MDEANHMVSFDADAVSRFSELEILEAVQMLTPAYRAVFNLYVIEGYSHKEISQLLDVNESTSRSNLVKARLKLQNILLKQR